MKIVIIGCGYIGQEAAKIWKKKGEFVTATTRTPEKLDDLSKIATKTVIINNADEEALAPLVAENEVIVVTIAADSSEEYENAYLNSSKVLKNLALEKGMPKRIIYTSSTSVYGDHHGQWVDENSPLLAKKDQAKILIEAENNYLSLTELGWKVCILRLTELYGPGRELSKRVAKIEGHVLPGNGSQYTNMLHKVDAAAAIDYALRHHLEGIYNVSDDEHPTRKELYTKVTQKFNYPEVKWDPDHTALHSGNKRISNHKIKAEGFAFHHPHRILD